MENLRLKTLFKLTLILLVVDADAYPSVKPAELSEIRKVFILNKANTDRQEKINAVFRINLGSPSSVAGNATACVSDAVRAAGEGEAGFKECVSSVRDSIRMLSTIMSENSRTGLDSMVTCFGNAIEASGFPTSKIAEFPSIAHEIIFKNEICSFIPSVVEAHQRGLYQSFLVHVNAVKVLVHLLGGSYE